VNKKTDSKIINEIQDLRSRGWSINKIYSRYNLGYGTVYRYIKDVKILPEYIDKWKKSYTGSTIRMNRDIDKARKQAQKIVNELSVKEKILFLAALYWGEGSKKDLNLINSDPDLIRIFLKGIRSYLKVPDNKIKINIRIFEDMDKEKCIKYWLNVTSLKSSNISNMDILKGKKKGKLEYGICRIRVLKGGFVLKYLKAIKDEVVGKY